MNETEWTQWLKEIQQQYIDWQSLDQINYRKKYDSTQRAVLNSLIRIFVTGEKI